VMSGCRGGFVTGVSIVLLVNCLASEVLVLPPFEVYEGTLIGVKL
jgi:hypothetical protein